MADRRGAVWHGSRRVGALREDAKSVLHFAYDTAWLDTDGFPISIRIPLSQGGDEVEAHMFFEGLLPEGKVRERICRQLGIAREDDVGLLLAIGGDCAGALSILPDGVEPEAKQQPARMLTQDQIDRLVRSAGSDTAALSDTPQRFSLAGVQEKQPVIFEHDAYALPDRAHPSSHILKFETLPRVCFAEFMAHDIARRLGLPVATTEFQRSGEGQDAVPYLRIARYDRERDASGRLQRLHQEDVLQALGMPTALKYQGHGGPGIGQVTDLLREHVARPAEALGFLRDWQMFNYLVGNWDGHGKNLALLYPPGAGVPDLAPFYDLVAIEFLNLISPHSWARDMAFRIGAHAVPEEITRRDWEAFAGELRMPPKRLLDRLEEITAQLPMATTAACEAFAGSHGELPLCERLEESVRRRCHWILNSVFQRN